LHRAFTLRSNGGILRQLQTQVAILPTSQKKIFEINAIWDTGATGSAITTKVVQELGLIPTGKAQVSTANGLAIQNTYTIRYCFTQ
jgi:hypothetical protein